MDPRSQQILDWICTGQHVIQADYDNDRSALTAPDNAAQPAEDDAASETSIGSSEVQYTLTGADNDLLSPSPADIDRVFRGGHATWTSFVKVADSLPPFAFPIELVNPAIMLEGVPCAPGQAPEEGLSDDPCGMCQILSMSRAPAAKTGICSMRECFLLLFVKPIECCVHSRPPPLRHGLLTAQRGLSVLTMCWSYILSVCLLELQGRKAVCSKHSLVPVSAHSFRIVAGESYLDLNLASCRFVR